MKQETLDFINWIKEQLDLNLHHLCVRPGKEGLKDIKNYKALQEKANTFLDSFVDNDFTTKIPESLKKAILNNDAEFYITFYYNSTTKELEKYIGVKRAIHQRFLSSIITLII